MNKTIILLKKICIKVWNLFGLIFLSAYLHICTQQSDHHSGLCQWHCHFWQNWHNLRAKGLNCHLLQNHGSWWDNSFPWDTCHSWPPNEMTEHQSSILHTTGANPLWYVAVKTVAHAFRCRYKTDGKPKPRFGHTVVAGTWRNKI